MPYLKNTSENHVSLFNGSILVKRGATDLISSADADTREVADAVRRGWVKLLSDVEGALVPVAELPPVVGETKVGAVSEVTPEEAAKAASKTRKPAVNATEKAAADEVKA